MDFHPDSGLDSFRQEVRQFLRRQLPPDLAGRARTTRSKRTEVMRWQGILNAQGWGAPSWAKEHGGTGWSVQQRLVFDEECAAVGAPTQDGFAQSLLGPVMNHFATAEQRAEHMAAILSGQRLWCQGFSEPGSGSDLASLRTRAERDGDHYLVNGQKIWTSYAHEADWIFLLVRTDPRVKKQAGISFLLADMKTPGITVRPIRSIDNCHHLNEVFLEDVRVPVRNRVGEEGGGWSITKFLLNNEHANVADLPALRRYLRDLHRIAATQRVGEEALKERPEFALRLSRLEGELKAIEMMVQRVASLEQEHSPTAHALGSMLKIRGSDLQQRLTEAHVEALGDYGAVAYPHPHEAAPGEPYPLQDVARGLANDMFFRRSSSIYGGTNEVQRGIIAKMLFQL
jgi:acyl-CoA dehydrogenase